VARWHLLTGEAPGSGGVGDYSAVLAGALGAAGETVSLSVERRPSALDAALGPPAPGRRLLFQYAPQAWGARGMNLGVCRWLVRRTLSGDDVRVMFHEPFYPFGLERPWRNLLAAVNRRMARLLLRAASRAYVSTAAWVPLLRPLAPPALAFRVLPIPSTVPFLDDPGAVRALRARLAADGRPLVVHFGTGGELIRPLLAAALGRLSERRPDARVLLLGRGGAEAAARRGAYRSGMAIAATGELSARELSLHLQAADVAVQPYPDGADTRRTTLMACLSCGLPTVTTRGPFTAVEVADAVAATVPASQPALLGDAAADLLDAQRAGAPPRPGADALRRATRALYQERFAVERSVERLLEDG
jgi:glycosyltransferase involved in cell wall biosynthesis